MSDRTANMTAVPVTANLTTQTIEGDLNVTGEYLQNGEPFSGSSGPVQVGCFLPGVGTNSQVCLYLAMAFAVTFPAGAADSEAVAKTAATGSTTFTLSKNGTQFATIVFSADGTTGAFTQAADADFEAGDILEIDGPATADATLANIGISLYGTR